MLQNNTTAEITFALLQDRSHVQAKLFATVVWSLWKSRNLRLWQNVTETTTTILECARQLFANWRVVNGKKLQGGLAVVAVSNLMKNHTNNNLMCGARNN